MLDDGYIISYGKMETAEGRPPTLYGLNPDSGYFIGVDIKKFSINFALMNLIGGIIETRMDVKCQLENTPEGLELLCDHIRDFLQAINIDQKRYSTLASTSRAGSIPSRDTASRNSISRSVPWPRL